MGNENIRGFTDKVNYMNIADAIRAKNGSTETYLPTEMADAINNIETGISLDTLENQAAGEHILNGYAAYNADGEIVSGTAVAEVVTDELIREAIDNYFYDNPIVTGATPEQLNQIQANTEAINTLSSPVSEINFTNFDNGSFTETINGEIITHIVTFDEQGRPSAIDDCVIIWGDA